MKSKIKFLSRAFACAVILSTGLFASCGSDDKPDGPIDSTGLLITANRSEAVAGESSISFIVTSEGELVTEQSQIVDANGQILPAVWTPTAKGVYSVSAIYNGLKSQKAVEINVYDPATTYFRHVELTKFTGTWCLPCAIAQRALDQVSDEHRNHLIMTAVHVNDSFTNDAGKAFFDALKPGNNIPTWYFNSYTKSSDISTMYITQTIKNEIANYPAVCVVKATSTVSGAKATIKATVKFDEAGDYKVGCVLVENSCYYQGGTITSNYYDHVLRSLFTDALGDAVTPAVTEAGERTFEFAATLNSAWKKENLEFNVYVYKYTKVKDQDRSVFIVNNGVTCPINGSVPYLHNPLK